MKLEKSYPLYLANRPHASKHALEVFDKYSGKRGFADMLIARMVPYFPSVLLNALGALSALGDILQTTGYFSARVVQMLPFLGALIAASVYSLRQYKRNERVL